MTDQENEVAQREFDQRNAQGLQPAKSIDPRDYGQTLDGCIEDMAGSLEKRAKHLRDMRGMMPRVITKPQFDAMWSILSNLRRG